MRQLLRLRSFWCWALVLALLGGLWVSSRIAPQELDVSNGAETIRLKNVAGAFEVEREIPLSIWRPPRHKARWTAAPLPPTPQAAYFPRPAWTDWQKKKPNLAASSAASGFHIGSTNTAAWEELLAGKQRSATLPYWLAMLAWLILCLPLLVWRWRAARRRSMEPVDTKAGTHRPNRAC